MNRVTTTANHDDDELKRLKSRCHTYRSATILRGRSETVAIQRAFEEARVALRLHGKCSLETSSNWASKVEQCAEALLTCGKMQEHAGNASSASAYVFFFSPPPTPPPPPLSLSFSLSSSSSSSIHTRPSALVLSPV